MISTSLVSASVDGLGLSAQVAVAEEPLGKATETVFLVVSPAAGVCVEVGELSASMA